MKYRTVSSIFAASLAGICTAGPRESVTFLSVDGNGLPDSPVNSVRQHAFSGGYALGKLTFSGTLTSVHTRTWRSDAHVRLTDPDGRSTTFRPFPSGGTFTNLAISGQAWLSPGADPNGVWTLRFYEEVDDGGTTSVDSRWDFTLTLTDDPPAPPPATDLGVIATPGRSVAPASLPAEGWRWYRFETSSSVAPLNGYLDIDTFGSVVNGGVGIGENDTQMVLFDAQGNVVASDDDSCSALLSQLSFGIGGRPPTLDGEPYDGQNGGLGRGVHFLAVGGYPLEFSAFWTVRAQSARSGSTALRFALGEPCRADFNNDGVSDFFDYLDFVAALDAEDPTADFNGDQVVDFFDYLDFVAAFDAGCD